MDTRVNRKNMLTHNSIAGTVVVYNNDYSAINNINTYLNQVDRLYIIDNSDKPNYVLSEWAKITRNVQYLANYGNPGVACALNRAADIAMQHGYSYLLTMDDDSRAPSDMVKNMISFLSNYTFPEQLGIISAAHTINAKGEKYRKINYCMTSGNLLNLHIYKKLGKFNTEFFIDHVDHEYNLRLTNAGFIIVELCDIKLDHKLGTVKCITILGKTISFISHSPIRFFYHVRNGIYIIRKYGLQNPIKCLSIMWIVLKEFVKSFLYEDEKLLRYNYFRQAVCLGWQGKLGKLTH